MKTICPICEKEMVFISSSHAKIHNTIPSKLKKKYPNIKISRLDGKKRSNAELKKLGKSVAGKNNPFYGKHHSKETIEQIVKTLKDPNGKHSQSVTSLEYKEIQRKGSTGKKNGFYGKHHTKESRKKMSATKSQLIADGKLNVNINGRGSKGWYLSEKNDKKFYYDSLLELYRMIQLDNDVDVKFWSKNHGIRIPYLKKGICKNYVPDFLIHYENGNVVLEEIKGYDPNAKIKKKALMEYCTKTGLIFNWINQEELKGYKKWIRKTPSSRVDVVLSEQT